MMSVLGIFSFLSFGWADILDILMVALIIFFLIRSIRKDSGILNIVLILAVLLILQGQRAFWAHTGDSRLYRLREGEIASVTEDHSVAYMKYRAGEITRAQIASDEDQSSLLRALGSSPRWKPQTSESGLRPGDAFLLCTDGFWEYVTDEEILIDRLKAENARDWAERMLLRAAERIPDNNDNMTLMTLITE